MAETILILVRRLAAHAILSHGDFFSPARTPTGRPVREGGISLGRPVAHVLTTDPSGSAVLVEFPFEIDDPGGVRRYPRLRFRVDVTTPEVVATSLWPTEPQAAAEFGVQEDLTLGTAPRLQRYRYLRPPPVVAATGTGEATFSWTLAASAEESLPQLEHRLFAVLRLPAGTTNFRGRLRAEMAVERRQLGQFQAVDVSSVTAEFQALVADPERVEPERGEPERGEPARRPRGPGGTPGRPHIQPHMWADDPLPSIDNSGRTVSTGLATVDRPNEDWSRSRCLRPDTDYLYWFAVGATRPGAIDDRAIAIDLPSGTPAGTVLTVALFSFPAEITITPGADIGELILRSDDRIEVHRQPGTGASAGDRLLFPIRTPTRPGRHRLRCNLYCRQTLLQSRLVQIEVSDGERWRAGAVDSTTDYVLDSTLDSVELSAVTPLRLSIFMNDNDDGTHGFRMLAHDGSDLIKSDVTISDADINDHAERARRALRKVAWGDEVEWDPANHNYLYEKGRRPDLAKDLIVLARAGYRIWWALEDRVAQSRTPAPGEPANRSLALAKLMRAPGSVEIATKYDAGRTLPAGLFYDYLLWTDIPQLTVCQPALKAIMDTAGPPLTEHPCFQGRCPSHVDPENEDKTVVCPGGFWGFRHQIGFPQSTRAGAPANRPAAPGGSGLTPVRYRGRPHCVVGVATEFDQSHPRRVADRGDLGSRPVIADRTRLLAALTDKRAQPHLIYLFCHGTVSPTGLPALRIGPVGSTLFTPDNVDRDMYWPDSRPLVILNGCRTAAVEPRYPFRFIDAFVRRSASGVIGTEITTFESLAIAFADRFLAELFRPGVGVAEAIRSARLDLLARGNPLGLIYVAYAAPQLRLEAMPATPAAE